MSTSTWPVTLGDVSADEVSPRPRRWRGREPDLRVRDRRDRLVAAAFDLLASQGAAAVTMRGVCREAGLTERYFYESFADRSELLQAVLERVVDDALTVIGGVVSSSDPRTLLVDVVTAFTAFLDADPRRARVLFEEAVTTPDLARPGLALVQRFVDVVEVGFARTGLVPSTADPVDTALDAAAAFGVLSRLFAARSAGRLPVDDTRFVTHVVALLTAIAATTTAP